MNLSRKYFICAFLLLVFSCEKEVKFKIGKQPEKLVVNCFCSPDSLLAVHVSKTASLDNLGESGISNARVDLYKQNIFLETLPYVGNSIYKSSNYPISPGSGYSLKVSANGFDTVYCEDQVPKEKIKMHNVKITKNAYTDQDGTYNEVQFTINDPSDQKNYYEIRIMLFYNDSIDPHYVSLYMTSKDPVILQEGDIYYYPETLLFSDNLFNGEKRQISIYYGGYTCYGCSDHPMTLIELRSVSKNYYTYKKSLIRHVANQSSDIWDGMANPVQLYTNVKNGYGIFASYFTDIDTVLN